MNKNKKFVCIEYLREAIKNNDVHHDFNHVMATIDNLNHILSESNPDYEEDILFLSTMFYEVYMFSNTVSHENIRLFLQAITNNNIVKVDRIISILTNVSMKPNDTILNKTDHIYLNIVRDAIFIEMIDEHNVYPDMITTVSGRKLGLTRYKEGSIDSDLIWEVQNPTCVIN